MHTVAETGRFRFLSRTLEIATNFATLVVAILISVVLVRNYLVPTSSMRLMQTRPSSVRSADLATPGTNMASRLPEINWHKNRTTLVLVLSTQCHFCTESAPFFRQIRDSVGRNVTLVGVLPQPVAEAEAYLNREGVHLDELKQISLDRVGITGTPTMLLVNGNGIVTQTWVGKLAPDKQEQALKVIGAVQARKGGGEL